MVVLFEYIVAGLAGSTVLIFLAKGVLSHILQRDLDYYEDVFDRGGDQDV